LKGLAQELTLAEEKTKDFEKGRRCIIRRKSHVLVERLAEVENQLSSAKAAKRTGFAPRQLEDPRELSKWS
jgi:hypothetical protein